MANNYSAVKAAVNGIMEDVPAPSGEAAEEIASPETTVQATPETAEAPAYGTGYGAYDSSETDRVHEIAEAIINEKWQELLSSVGNIAVWKERVDTNIISIKQEIVRINERFDNLQNAVLGKVKEYDIDMKNVHTEMKALEKVFERIIEPLTSNVKELNKITKELKEIR